MDKVVYKVPIIGGKGETVGYTVAKYSLNERVWVFDYGIPIRMEIASIFFGYRSFGSIDYKAEENRKIYHEDEIFPSRKELVKHLNLEKYGVKD